MRHSEASRPQPAEAAAEEQPKFDIEKEAAAAKAESEISAPETRFARDAADYRAIGDKLARKEKEKQDLTEASGAFGKVGTRGAEALGRVIDSEIAELKQQRDELLAGYGEGGKEFTDALAALDELNGKLAEKQAKLDKLETMISFLDYPGGERGAKAEIEFLKGSVADLNKEMQALQQKFEGQAPSRETVEALADLRQIEKERVAGEKAAAREARIKAMGERVDAAMAKEDAEARESEEEPILLTPEMRKKPAAEKKQTVERPSVAKADKLIYEAFREMKPISRQEMDTAVAAKQFTPERQAELNQAVSFLENRSFDLIEGAQIDIRTEKPDGTTEIKSVHEAGTKELAETIMKKYGVDIEKQNDANAVSALKRFGFGLKKLFNPGLRRLVNEHNDKANLAAELTGEANATKKMMQDPGAYRARMEESALKMYDLRQRMKRPPPKINVKVR